jgi:hypothetical protein
MSSLFEQMQSLGDDFQPLTPDNVSRIENASGHILPEGFKAFFSTYGSFDFPEGAFFSKDGTVYEVARIFGGSNDIDEFLDEREMFAERAGSDCLPFGLDFFGNVFFVKLPDGTVYFAKGGPHPTSAIKLANSLQAFLEGLEFTNPDTMD